MGNQKAGPEDETVARQRGEASVNGDSGVLYLCATPIGNLEDITLRVMRVLKEVDLVTAEDTRHTRKLLTHLDIHTPITSYHQHNEAVKAGKVIAALLAGKNVALVSDAGMPGISDPGTHLVAAAVQAGIKVVPLPGASAVVTGLVASGLPTDRFVFEGFLPRGKKQRQQRLKEIAGEERTVVLYEAPHRVLQTLQELAEIIGSRGVAVARELTKTYEEIIRGTAKTALEYFSQQQPRGEFTIIIGGGKAIADRPVEQWPESMAEHVNMLITGGMEKKSAIKEVAVRLGVSKRDVYNAVLQKM